MRPIERFIGGDTSPALLEAIREQYIVHGNTALAAALAKVVKLMEHVPGARLIEQGNADNHILRQRFTVPTFIPQLK